MCIYNIIYFYINNCIFIYTVHVSEKHLAVIQNRETVGFFTLVMYTYLSKLSVECFYNFVYVMHLFVLKGFGWLHLYQWMFSNICLLEV